MVGHLDPAWRADRPETASVERGLVEVSLAMAMCLRIGGKLERVHGVFGFG